MKTPSLRHAISRLVVTTAIPLLIASAPPTARAQGDTASKLSVTIPSVEFVETPLRDALDFLVAKSREAAPGGNGAWGDSSPPVSKPSNSTAGIRPERR